ncbi:nuclear transport factor 2 family protein [Catellatospora citrea]|uniref:SnoaL-like domain-containing protein n=1 Tax=Catellatospora citrea TaxID=53366 RepID=A0A8J3KGS6_9ACTN|nr:nuclear transport factor 2 family protein [Catellatospora citrea]RKE05522.1 ketosteroid isomerase-like protein [Catellatospora citrea]GIF96870.1 hypothetical protein Cci01nite_19640 [Catellatospora citrea]
MNHTTETWPAVTDYYRYVDAGDINALVDLFSKDAVYHRPGFPPIVGHDGLLRFYASGRVIAHGRHQLHQIVADGSRIAVNGTFDGVLKDHTCVSLAFADFFTLAGDGRFQERRTFFGVPAV